MRTTLLVALTLTLTQATEVRPSPPEAREIADTVPGAMLPNRGNTVIFTAPDGLIVVDTGRPAWHSDGILAFAAERRQRVRAIVNTHWHLDHASGNGRIKAAHPEARSRLPSEAASPSITIPARLQSAQAHRGGARYARLTGGTP
jgi:glyoxylase-like metal-dependent hydrolase (beta-lactamase superfamily II)